MKLLRVTTFLFAFLLIFLLFIPLFPVLGSSQSQESTNQGIATGITSSLPLKFSILKQNNSESIFFSYIAQRTPSEKAFFLNLYNYSISNSSYVGEIGVPFSTLFNSTPTIKDFNFFQTNNVTLLTISSIINSTDHFNIYALHNDTISETFSLNGSSPYVIEYITSFSNSSDIYFSVYNTSSFFIIKYDYQANSFSLVFLTPKLNSMFVISNVNVFKLDNKLFLSYTTNYSNNYLNINSNIYILEPNRILFNKTFTNLDVTTFTPYSAGLLLYSYSNSTFFNYQYTSDTVAVFHTNIAYNANMSTFKPFNNQSFLILGYEYLMVENINYNNSVLTLQNQYTYLISNSNNQLDHSVIQTFILQSQMFYVYGTINNNNLYNFDVHDIRNSPFEILLQPSSTISYSSSAGLDLNSPGNTDPIFIIIIVLLAMIIIPVTYAKFKKPVVNETKLIKKGNNDQLAPKKANEKTQMIPSLTCSSCGFESKTGDVFCQNCGQKLEI